MNVVNFQDAVQGRAVALGGIGPVRPCVSAEGVAGCLALLEQEARGMGLTLAAHLIAVARQAVDEEARAAAG